MTDNTSSDTSTASVDRSGPSSSDGGLERRTVIRLLVGAGIGVPVLVELSTFAALVDQWLSGAESEPASAERTETTREVGVGDELLPETPQREVLEDGRVAAGEQWALTLSVSVRNEGETPYALTLGAVETGSGRRVEGGGESGAIAVGESTTVVGRWTLPDGETPRKVQVESDRGGETTRATVSLGKIPVVRR